MKRIIIIIMGVLLLMSGNLTNAKKSPSELLQGVEHFKQSTLRMQKDGKVIYFDPYQVPKVWGDGDLVFVTHPHGDHYSPQDIKKVLKSGGTLVITVDMAGKAEADGFKKVVTVAPDKEYTAEGVSFKAVPAYNTNKPYHARNSNWVGYLVSLAQGSYYFAGDTDLIPEMKDIKADVVFLPVGGTYTMTAEEAARAANLIKPAAAVPIHFGDVVGSRADAEKFISLLDQGIEGVIIKK